MTEKDIKQLVARFMDGETSLDEERRLAEYFRSHPNEPEMEDMVSLFALFDTGMPIEGVTGVEPKAPAPHHITLHPVWWASVAAVAVVLVAFTFLSTSREQKTTNVVCQVPRQAIEEQVIEKQSATQYAPTAEPVAEPATSPVPRGAHKSVVAKAKPKSQSKAVPEIVPDSVVEATLKRQEMKAQIRYEQQMLAQAQAEREMQQQAMLMEAVAEYVANMEYVETIQVW